MKKVEEWVCRHVSGIGMAWVYPFGFDRMVGGLFATDYPEGTRLRVTAEVLEPEQEQEKNENTPD